MKRKSALYIQLCLFPHTDDNTVGPVIPVEYFTSGKGNDPVHFFCHFFYAQETELLAGCHAAETCPHVFIAPSAIPAVVYVNPYTFFHYFRAQLFLQG